MVQTFFDPLADVYDALIDWPRRLARESPFLQALFAEYGVRRVLDAACGTGHHAALFAQWGCDVEGADVSPTMIATSRARHGEREHLRWVERAFSVSPPEAAFDAVVCLGNSLALAPNAAELAAVLANFVAALRPGAVCLVQLLNLGALPDGPLVWQKCRRLTLAGRPHLALKGVQRSGDRGYVHLTTMTLDGEPAVATSESTPLLDLPPALLAPLFAQAGAPVVATYGDYQKSAFDRDRSTDVLLVAQRHGLGS